MRLLLGLGLLILAAFCQDLSKPTALNHWTDNLKVWELSLPFIPDRNIQVIKTRESHQFVYFGMLPSFICSPFLMLRYFTSNKVLIMGTLQSEMLRISVISACFQQRTMTTLKARGSSISLRWNAKWPLSCSLTRITNTKWYVSS